MTPQQIKQAAERQWQRRQIGSVDRPAGWVAPSDAWSIRGGSWRGDENELWRRQTTKPVRPQRKRRKPREELET